MREFGRSDKAGTVSLIEQVNPGKDVPQSQFHQLLIPVAKSGKLW
jgi:hypothetical protein